MEPRIDTWAVTKRKPRPRKSPAAAAPSADAAPAAPAAVAIATKKKRTRKKSPLGSIPTKGAKKKSDKPLVTLTSVRKEKVLKDGKEVEVEVSAAERLLRLLKLKAHQKALKSTIGELENDLLGEIEGLRLEVNRKKNEYIGSVNVQGTGNVNSGQLLYYVMNKYTPFDPDKESPDEELQEELGGDATLKDEAIAAIAATMNWEEEEAEKALDRRTELSYSISVLDTALQNPEAFLLIEKLSQLKSPTGDSYLIQKPALKPKKTFHERSSFESEDAAIMKALQEIGLLKRYKAVLKA